MSDEVRPGGDGDGDGDGGGGGGGEKPDLRFTRHEGEQVKGSRDLSGGGHLARGDRTNMSRLNFSARARPADPGERDLSAFGGRTSPEDALPADAPPAVDPVADTPPAPAPGLIQKMGRFFGL